MPRWWRDVFDYDPEPRDDLPTAQELAEDEAYYAKVRAQRDRNATDLPVDRADFRVPKPTSAADDLPF